MPTELDLIEAISQDAGTGDRFSEYVYADYLDEIGDPRAEAWRVLLEAGKRPEFNYNHVPSTPDFWLFGQWQWFPETPSFSEPIPHATSSGL